MTVFNTVSKKNGNYTYPAVRVIFKNDAEKVYKNVQYIYFSSVDCISITTNNQKNVIKDYQLKDVRLISYIS